jgi:hypothetical protein
MLKPKYLKQYLIGIFFTGILAFLYLLLIPLDPSRGKLINYSLMRVVFLISIAVGLLALAALFLKIQLDKKLVKSLSETIHQRLTQPLTHLFNFQFGIIIAFIFSVEGFLLTYFSFPVPMRPLTVWLSLICLFTWLTLRLVYADHYKKKQSLADQLKSGWQKWSETQRKVFIILVIMGLVYFIIFFPINYGGRVHPDEDIIYPDVVNMLIPGETFMETLRDSFIIDSWWYGYPYFPICALTLVIPRLIYGIAFAEKLLLNLMLLRQFVSVLPMIVAIIWLIYLINAFKSVWESIGMFLVFALIPGVVNYNTRFWHPDSIIVLLIIITFWFLKRDQLRFGLDFFLAAAAIGLNAAIKVWGLFFFLAIGGYLLVGWIKKKLTFWKMVRAGIFFILVMVGTILITSPSILIPWNLKTYIAEMQEYYPIMRYGYNEPDPQGVYRTGLQAWMVFFRIHYMQDFFFYFSVFAVLVGSLLGTSRYLNRLILAWCGVIGVYLVGWIAVKSYQYMLPLMIPLYAGAFLFPHIAGGDQIPPKLDFLADPKAKRILKAILIVLVLIQFIFNLKMMSTSLKF